MTSYYKAIRTDGTDFRTGRVKYDVGATVTHPNPHKADASGYLSVAVTPTDCTGAKWPLRLMEVEAAEVWTDSSYPNKRRTHSLTVVRELDPTLALGPQGQAIVALIERAGGIDYSDAKALAAARAAAGTAAWAAARDAAGAAAGTAAWDAAWDAARAAAGTAARAAAWAAAWAATRAATRAAAGLMVRDLIGDGFTQEQYDLLTGPWRKAIGPIHPDDADLRETKEQDR